MFKKEHLWIAWTKWCRQNINNENDVGVDSITDGNITMFGMQFPANKAEILRRVGVMIETPGFYPNLTATENLQILSSLRDVTDKNAIQKSLELVGLPYKDKKMFSEYSLGMKQRLGIANVYST